MNPTTCNIYPGRGRGRGRGRKKEITIISTQHQAPPSKGQ